MVASSAMLRLPYSSALRAIEQICVDASIDFPCAKSAQHPDSQYRHLLAQSFTRSNSLLLGFSTCGGDDLLTFLRSTGFGFFNDSLGTALGVGQAGGSRCWLQPILSSHAGQQRRVQF